MASLNHLRQINDDYDKNFLPTRMEILIVNDHENEKNIIFSYYAWVNGLSPVKFNELNFTKIYLVLILTPLNH